MPHQVHQRTFGRTTGPRTSMLRNLTLSVLRYEKVRTTEAKAKEIRGFVDRMINLGKDGSLAARRRAIAWLPETVIVDKVFGDLAQRFPNRTSGYTRLTHLPPRHGDSSPRMLIELVDGVDLASAADDAAKPRRRLGLPGRRVKSEAAGAKPAASAEPAGKSGRAKPKAAKSDKAAAAKG